jgi:hypothetical protein
MNGSLDHAASAQNRSCRHSSSGSDDVSGSADERSGRADHRGDATSDRTHRAPNGPQDRSAARGETLADSPTCSEREAGGVHEGASQPHPRRSDSCTGTGGQPHETGSASPGETDDCSGHHAECVTGSPHDRADRTRQRTKRASQRRKHARHRSHDRSDGGFDNSAEPTDEAEHEATSTPDGNDDPAPRSPCCPPDRSDHPTRQHRDSTPPTADRDRAGTSPATSRHQASAQNAADAMGDVPNRDDHHPSRAAQPDADTTGERSDGSPDCSAELTETSSNRQKWARRSAPYASGR